MTTELKMLGWSIFLGLAYVLIAAALATQQRGVKWNAGNREGEKPLTGVADRAARASRNFLETFPFFATAVLAIAMTSRFSPQTTLGAELYFWGRVAYLPIYLAGIPYVRTVVWAVALWGLLKVTLGLF